MSEQLLTEMEIIPIKSAQERIIQYNTAVRCVVSLNLNISHTKKTAKKLHAVCCRVESVRFV